MLKKIIRVSASASKGRSTTAKHTDTSQMTLPDDLTIPDTNLSHYAFLIYGNVKVGKTTLLHQFPKTIFFLTEPGAKGLAIYEFNKNEGGVHNWRVLRKGVELLEENPGKFQTMVIDTGDRAYDMCLDYVCEVMDIPYPGETSEGKNDYGKAWRAVRQEFTHIIHRVQRIGVGLMITSHAIEIEIKQKHSDAYHRIVPSMSKQARGVVEGIVDFIFFADYMRDLKGDPIRVLVCQGDDYVWAGGRQLPNGGEFPKLLPLKKKGGYEIITEAFKGNYTGINPKNIMTSERSSKAMGDSIKQAKRESQ